VEWGIQFAHIELEHMYLPFSHLNHFERGFYTYKLIRYYHSLIFQFM